MSKIAQQMSVSVNARIGVAWFPAHGDQLLPLLQAAEAALLTIGEAVGGIALAPLPLVDRP